MLTSDELEALRAAQEETMTDVCTVLRRGVSSDGLGGERETWSMSGSAMCRVGTVSRLPLELAQAERLTNTVPYMVTLPASASVGADDRLQVVSGLTAGLERTFEVVGPMRSSFDTALRCVCVEVK